MDALDRALAQRGVDRRGDARDPHPRRRRGPRLRRTRPSRSAATCPRRRPRALIEHGQTWEDRGERGLAAGGRVARAARDPRRAGRRDAGRRRVRRGRRRGRRHPGGPRRRTARCAASRRSSTRTSRPPCSARDPRRRRARHRHRRRRTRCSASAPTEPRPIGRVDAGRDARPCAAQGQFASGSMGPRWRLPAVRGGRAATPAVITSLQRIGDGGHGRAGTIVVEQPEHESLTH